MPKDSAAFSDTALKVQLAPFSDDDLKRELDRRSKPSTKIPKPSSHPDFSGLIKYIVYGAHEYARDGREPKDFEHNVFEKALVAVYGEMVWDWWNQLAR